MPITSSRCPACQMEQESSNLACVTCGADLSSLAMLALVRTELTQAHEIIGDQLKKIDQRVKLFEGKVSALIQASSPKRPSESATKALEPSAPTKVGSDTSQTSTSPTAQPVAPQPRPAPSPPSSPTSARDTVKAEVQFGQRWLLIGGVLTFLFGVGYFLKYSFDKNWIGPAGRVLLAYLTSSLFVGGGEAFRRRNFSAFGLTLIGTGIAALYLSTCAGFQIYHLFGQPLAFIFMVFITIFAGTLAVVYDHKGPAVIGIIGGFLTPILLSTGQDNQIILMSYMVVLNCGILGVSSFKRWRVLTYLGFTCTWLLFAGWYIEHYQAWNTPPFWTTTIYLNTFFLIYTIAPLLYFLRRDKSSALEGTTIIAPNAFIAFAFSYDMIRAYAGLPAVGVVTVAYAAVFAWTAQLVYRRAPEHASYMALQLSQAVLFLVITIPLIVSGHWITIFWSVQACTLLWAAQRLANKRLYNGSLLLLAITTGKLLCTDYPHLFEYGYENVFAALGESRSVAAHWLSIAMERWIGALSVLGALFFFGRRITANSPAAWGTRTTLTAIVWSVLGGSSFLALTCEVSSFFATCLPSARGPALSVLWTIYSLTLLSIGFRLPNSRVRKCAIVLFGITIAKVFLSDMASASTPFRILSFMVLGAMLIVASFLYHRFKDRLIPPSE